MNSPLPSLRERAFEALTADIEDRGSTRFERLDAVCEISRQLRQQSNTREAGAVQQTARTNHGD